MTPLGVFAEMLAAAMNSHSALGDHSAIYAELQVLNWFKQILGFPTDASGLLVTGCSMANIIGLAVARNTRMGFDVREKEIGALGGLVSVYCSAEAHSSLQKAVELLGLGNEALRRIRTNQEYQLDLDILKKTIEQDRLSGHHPLCVVGNAGTTNSGAIDPLNEIADICRQEKLWFHVDGAFGAWASLLPEYKNTLSGLARADSIAFDLHKWLFMPYESGCILIRDERAHRRAFSVLPEYLRMHDRGVSAGPVSFGDYGPEQSRGFRALKIWLTLKAYGLESFQNLIRQNILQARYLASQIDCTSELELVAPVSLNVVCFRYVAAEISNSKLNYLNKEILIRLQESGVAVPSSTMIAEKYAIRVCITNHRSRREDLDFLVRRVLKLGQEIQVGDSNR